MIWRQAVAPLLLAGMVAACRPAPDGRETTARAVPVPPQAASRAARPFPKGSLFSETAGFQLAVYHLPTPRVAPERVVRNLLRGPFARFRRGDAAGAAPGPTVLVAEPPIADYAPPSPDRLTYSGHGLSAQVVQEVQRARRVTTLSFRIRAPGDFGALREAYRLVSALAQATGGLIWDEETRELFSTRAWDERRVQGGWSGGIIHVPAHTVIHAYPDPELVRSVTLGMVKLGLPDVVVEGIPRSNSGPVGNLVNLVCQTMVERGSLDVPGQFAVEIDTLADRRLRETLVASLVGRPPRKALLSVALGEPADGDARNRLMEVTFPVGAHGVQEGQQAVLDGLFGSSDEVTRVDHDEALLAASRRAQSELVSRLKPRFRAGLAPGESLLVKAPFTTSRGGHEWMWVEVVRWEGRTIHGILMNDPEEVPDLVAGAQVEVPEAGVFDYIHRLPDGSQRGNETGKMITDRAAGTNSHP